MIGNCMYANLGHNLQPIEVGQYLIKPKDRSYWYYINVTCVPGVVLDVFICSMFNLHVLWNHNNLWNWKAIQYKKYCRNSSNIHFPGLVRHFNKKKCDEEQSEDIKGVIKSRNTKKQDNVMAKQKMIYKALQKTK